MTMTSTRPARTRDGRTTSTPTIRDLIASARAIGARYAEGHPHMRADVDDDYGFEADRELDELLDGLTAEQHRALFAELVALHGDGWWRRDLDVVLRSVDDCMRVAVEQHLVDCVTDAALEASAQVEELARHRARRVLGDLTFAEILERETRAERADVA